MAAKRFRLKFMFWLDMSKSDEYELAEQIEILKQERRFSETLRDGIRLICDLRAGRTERLFGMFPWLAAEVGQGAAADSQALQQEIDRLWGAITSQPSSAPQMSQPLPQEADEVQLQVKTAKNGASGKNFLSSLLSLQQ